MSRGDSFDPEIIRLRSTLHEIVRAAVLSAHPTEKYQRNMQTIDHIRDIARRALAVAS